MARIPETSDGKMIVSLWPTEGSRKTIVSHNFCDPTTWYQNSTEVLNETPSTLVAGTTFEVSNDYLIDSFHAKLWEETKLTPDYRVIVETSSDSGTTWVARDEEDPHVEEVSGSPDGDYVIDYDTGVITFHSSIGSDLIRVSYHYADLTNPLASHFVFEPAAGKALKLRRAEVQFTTDIILNDSVKFETYGYVDVFAPQLLQANGGPLPSGTKIPISETIYNSMRDFYNEANGAQPTYPALGGSGWRGLNVPVVVLQWDYAAVLPISSSAGMETHIYLVNNEVFGGTYATATVYGLSEDE